MCGSCATCEGQEGAAEQLGRGRELGTHWQGLGWTGPHRQGEGSDFILRAGETTGDLNEHKDVISIFKISPWLLGEMTGVGGGGAGEKAGNPPVGGGGK